MRSVVRRVRAGGAIHLVALLAMLAIAAFFRLYRLDAIPYGLYFDEAGQGLDALDALSGNPRPFSPRSNGHEPLYGYLVAPFVLMMGRIPLAVRLPAAVSGLVAVAMIYMVGREMFLTEGERLSHRIAMMATLSLAISYWAVTISRIGFPSTLIPAFALTTFYFFWRGWNRRLRDANGGSFFGLPVSSSRDFCLAGIFLGLSLYTFIPSRLLPLVVTSFVLCPIIMSNGKWKGVLPARAEGGRHMRSALRALVLIIMCALLVSAPLTYYFLNHPDDFMRKANTVSVFNPDVNEGDPLKALMRVSLGTLGMFFLAGDPNIRHNPAQRPVFDPFMALWFVIGLVTSCLNWKKPPYLFAIFWFSIMLLPTVLSLGTVPHWFRAAGSLPVAHLFVAVGVSVAWQWLERRNAPRRWTSLIYIIFLAMLCFSAFTGYQDYFSAWTGDSEQGLRDAFDMIFFQAADTMNALDRPQSVWILPITSLAQPGSEHYTIEFLYQGAAPHHYLRVDERNAARELTEISHAHKEMLVIEWSESALGGAYIYYADPKGLLPFVLKKYGRLAQEGQFDGFSIQTYELPASSSFAIAESFEPVSIDFGDEIGLSGVSYGGSSLRDTSTPSEVDGNVLPSGKSGWVVLLWQASSAVARDYKVGVYLTDSEGRLVGQMDKVLLSNYLQPTSQWRPGQLEMDYYTLLSLPATPPGEYNIEVVVYDAETMQRLTVFDEQERVTKTSVVVGTLQVVEPLIPPQVEPMEQLLEPHRDIAPGIRLLGYDLPVSVLSPGDTVSAALYWQALEDVNQDYYLSFGLKDTRGHVSIEQLGRPVDDTYPTTEWDQGEVLRDWHDLTLPADMPQGLYQLFIGVLKQEELLGEVALGQVEVQGRARQFAIPQIQHPMEARLGEAIRFLGYDLSTNQVKPGDSLHLTLYWQALEQMEASYTVFTHLLDAQDQIWGQRDSLPGGGEAPTSSWVEGEIITDEYEIKVDPEASPADYVIEIGMYDSSTGQRLAAFGDDQALEQNRLLLGVLQVVP